MLTVKRGKREREIEMEREREREIEMERERDCGECMERALLDCLHFESVNNPTGKISHVFFS
jgi:hypothetical protein